MRSSTYYFHIKAKILADFQICISVALKITIEEKNWRSQNFDFLGLENLSPCQFCGVLTHEDIIEF